MFQYILGIIIDPKGNYLSFGTMDDWELEEGYEYLGFHGRSVLLSILNSGWIYTHPELDLGNVDFEDLKRWEISKDIEQEIYQYFQRWWHLGYVIFFNSSTDYCQIMGGYIPKQLTREQMKTLLVLKKDLIYQNNMNSDLYLDLACPPILSIYDLYEKIDQHILNRTLL